MARFRFSGSIKRVTVEYIHIEDGIIDVTKKAVCDELGLPKVVDGDSQHWIDEAESAVECGADFKIVDTDGAEWKLSNIICEAEHIENMEYDA